jgi:MarR family transcriptional regulator, organic hydroperoxide resistance regulator
MAEVDRAAGAAGGVADAGDLALDAQLCFALQSASRAIVGTYRPGLEALGLTYSQYTVMLVLWEQGPVSLGHLSRALHSDSGTLSPLLKRLELVGLVTRRRRRDDERVLEVAPTEAALALREPAAAVQRRVAAATGLRPDELAALRSELEALTARLHRAELDLGASGAY